MDLGSVADLRSLTKKCNLVSAPTARALGQKGIECQYDVARFTNKPGQVQIKKEVLAEFLLCRKIMGCDDFAQRRKAIIGKFAGCFGFF